MRRLILLALPIAASLSLYVACDNTPEIDGSKVAKIGSAASPPTCEGVCDRLGKLCGRAPLDCVAACADGGYDDGHRLCVGQAPNCQAALQTCANEEPADGGETDGESDAAPQTDGGPDDAATEDGGADARSDGASDAATGG